MQDARGDADAALDPEDASHDRARSRCAAEIEQTRAPKPLRERAELDNQRKRLARDVDMARKFANERLLGELLPVFDSLEAGLAVPADTGRARCAKAWSSRCASCSKVAERQRPGRRSTRPGEAFNPDRHQAMSMVDGAGMPPGSVVQVFQKG